MAGSAPKFSATGSHTEVTRNLKPNLETERCDCLISSKAIRPTITMTESAQRMTSMRKVASAKALFLVRKRSLKAAGTAVKVAAGGSAGVCLTGSFIWARIKQLAKANLTADDADSADLR